MVRRRRQTIADGLAAWLRSCVSIIISEMRSLTLALFLTVGLGAPAVAGQVADAARPPRRGRRIPPTYSCSAAISKGKARWTRRSPRTSRRSRWRPSPPSCAPSSPAFTPGPTRRRRRWRRRKPSRSIRTIAKPTRSSARSTPRSPNSGRRSPRATIRPTIPRARLPRSRRPARTTPSTSTWI